MILRDLLPADLFFSPHPFRRRARYVSTKPVQSLGSYGKTIPASPVAFAVGFDVEVLGEGVDVRVLHSLASMMIFTNRRTMASIDGSNIVARKKR